MKKFGILTMVLTFIMMGSIYAQPNQSANRPVTQYIKDNVAPAVKQAQQKFIEALSSTEKAELAKIQAELKAFRAEGKQNQLNKQGNFNQQKWVDRQQAMKNILDQAEKIVAAHPEAAKAYTDFIADHASKWEAGLAQIRQDNGYGVNRPMNAGQFVFQRLSNPAFGLIVDTDNLGNFNRTLMRNNRPGGMQPNGRGYGQGRGNNWNKGGMCGQRMGRMQGQHGFRRGNRGMGAGRGTGFRAMQNPEMKAKMLAYAKENIFPVVSKERQAFDKYLSGSEKREIEKARVKLAELHKEMLANFQKGVRPFRGQPDSTRLALRLKIDEVMLPVKQIALKHYGELETVTGKIRQDFMGWGRGMRMAVAQGQPAGKGQFRGMNGNGRGMGPGGQGMGPRQGCNGLNNRAGMRNGGMGFIGPVKFLLYNPANPEASLPLMAQPMPASVN
ncbi:MAG: hypothetical protein JXR71_09135 [Bacteroidales bacterium]|nr:hypothetical protein [Bacteroidales bacterium]